MKNNNFSYFVVITKVLFVRTWTFSNYTYSIIYLTYYLPQVLYLFANFSFTRYTHNILSSIKHTPDKFSLSSINFSSDIFQNSHNYTLITSFTIFSDIPVNFSDIM